MNDHMARWSAQPQDDHQHALYEEESFHPENYSPYEEELWLCIEAEQTYMSSIYFYHEDTQPYAYPL